MAAVVAAVAASGGAAAFSNEPAGFGAARLRARAEAVRRAFPALEPAGGVPAVQVAFYRLPAQQYLGLAPCDLRFGFIEDRLYEIQFDCGRGAAVRTALEREFGPPTLREPYGVFWYGEQVAVSLSPGSQVFGIADRTLLQTAQQAIARAVAAERAAGAPAPGR